MTGAPEKSLHGWMTQRFERLEAVLADREWLSASRFTIADILMVDALRVPKDLGELEPYEALRAYVARGCGRPAFRKAHADQLAHSDAADARRSGD